MFIDIHGHFQRNPGFPFNGKPYFAPPEQLIERYDKLGIEKGPSGVVLPLLTAVISKLLHDFISAVQYHKHTSRTVLFSPDGKSLIWNNFNKI
jgi:hypothetical protein